MLTKVRSYVAARVAVAYLAIVRLCLIVAVAVLGFAGEIFAQTTGNTGTEFDEFPKFFDMASLVTQGIAYLTAAAILIVAAVVGWRMTMKLVNMFIRRVG